MFETFTESERDNLFITVARPWLDLLKASDAKEIIRKTNQVFWQWREDQADENGMIAIKRPTGILAALAAGISPDAPAEKHYCDATLSEIAGYIIPDEIALAFKLWLDDYRPFKDVLGEFGVFRVFSVIGLYESKTADIHSLIRLNSLFATGLNAFAADIIKNPQKRHNKQPQKLATEAASAKASMFEGSLYRYIRDRRPSFQKKGGGIDLDAVVKSLTDTNEKSTAAEWGTSNNGSARWHYWGSKPRKDERDLRTKVRAAIDKVRRDLAATYGEKS